SATLRFKLCAMSTRHAISPFSVVAQVGKVAKSGSLQKPPSFATAPSANARFPPTSARLHTGGRLQSASMLQSFPSLSTGATQIPPAHWPGGFGGRESFPPSTDFWQASVVLISPEARVRSILPTPSWHGFPPGTPGPMAAVSAPATELSARHARQP